jgi:DNA replicative helicase MCM subunit Mcm2 (Cdc46/Mcm family)
MEEDFEKIIDKKEFEKVIGDALEIANIIFFEKGFNIEDLISSFSLILAVSLINLSKTEKRRFWKNYEKMIESFIKILKEESEFFEILKMACEKAKGGSIRDKIVMVLEKIKEIEEREGIAEEDTLREELRKEGLNDIEISKILNMLITDGRIYCPKPRMYKMGW